MAKKIIAALFAAVLFVSAPMLVRADEPYRSYTKTSWSNEAPAPAGFLPTAQYGGGMLPEGGLNEPVDFCIDEKGYIYIADSKNNRVVITDNEFSHIKTITEVLIDGKAEPLNQPRGIFVKDGFIYLADTENARALKINDRGEVERQYLRPENAEYTAEAFRPSKIAVDKDDSVFLLCEGVFQGLLFYSNDGQFKSYFGSVRVQPTIKLMTDRMWKNLLSKEIRNSMANYVPVEYSGLDVDKAGYLYVCSPATESNTEQIRKLNYLGNNIFSFTGNFGENDIVYFKRNFIKTIFEDVAIDENGVLYAADSTRGKIYCFDKEGKPLVSFGTKGEMNGGLLFPAAVDTYQGKVYVLDKETGLITVFEPTLYGSLIMDSVKLYYAGEYAKAQSIWETILTYNGNFQAAYEGMGEAMMKTAEYKKAMEYFKIADNRERESAAFKKYRTEILRDYFGWAATAVLIAALALFIAKKAGLFKKIKTPANKWCAGIVRELTNIKNVLKSPVNTFNELKYKRYTNVALTGVLLLLLLLVKVSVRQFSGFRFNSNDPETLHIGVEFCVTVVLFMIFCTANWACCSIMDGEGKFGEICTFCAVSLVPYILFSSAGMVLSNVLILEEGGFLSGITAIGVLWSGFLLFQGLRIVHQYSTLKTAAVILMSIAGIVIVLFLLLLLFSLYQQISSFVRTILSELAYGK